MHAKLDEQSTWLGGGGLTSNAFVCNNNNMCNINIYCRVHKRPSAVYAPKTTSNMRATTKPPQRSSACYGLNLDLLALPLLFAHVGKITLGYSRLIINNVQSICLQGSVMLSEEMQHQRLRRVY